MKKKIVNPITHRKSITSIRKVMVFSMVCLLLVWSKSVQAQTVKYSLSMDNASIESVINELRSQAELNFIYNDEEVKKCQPISIHITDADLDEILTQCLANTGLTFSHVNNTIVIAPVKKSSSIGASKDQLTQTIRGIVLDQDSQRPLIGATVLVVGSDPIIGAMTDIDGHFRLERIAVGRVSLAMSYIGYKNKMMSNLIVNSGKERVLNLTMQESATTMEGVVISAMQHDGAPINDMATVSARSVSAEETRRYAGGFSDPSRILASFAGVSSSPNGENDLIIRGNSPKYVQWRLEGMEITNPTHFADQNAIKGGISALNNNLLSTSDFYTGAFTAEFGDVLSGVYDVKLRAGNNEHFEAAFGFGLLGTDLTLEGPFKKDYAGSYLVNYRYSTVALVNDLGLIDVEGDLGYHDLTFKTVLPTKKAGTFSIFGLGGVSGFELQDISPDGQTIPDINVVSADVVKDNHKQTFLVNSGLNHMLSLSKNSYLNTSLSVSSNGITDEVFESTIFLREDSEGNPLKDSVLAYASTFDSRLVKTAYRGEMTYSNRINSKNKIQVGVKYTLFDFDYEQSQLEQEGGEKFTTIDFNEKMSTIRSFVSWKYNINENVHFVSGLQNMNVLYNNQSTLEPRLAMNWQINSRHAVHAGYGLHSTMESIHHYFTKIKMDDGSISEPNKDLGLLKAHHFVLGYGVQLTKSLRLSGEVYYQHLYDLPVDANDTSYYATINEGIEFNYVPLVNEGTGKNYGLELTLEKSFNKNYYFMINGSLYNSTYKSLENVVRNTANNGHYIVNVLVGKEFTKLGKKGNQTLALNSKVYFGGGKNIVPLLRDDQGGLAVDPANNEYYDYSKAYEDNLDDVFQINLSASYKWNKPRTTHELFLDLVNLTNNTARMYEYYDETEPTSIGYVSQFGFIPNLMYRVYF
ncbi:MAG: carboxypeptidase-like regulatory domain-containing protein [Reichenbachiella sp.]